MTTKTSGIVVLLMTAGILSLIHGASRAAFQNLASGAPTLFLGIAGTVQAFVMARRPGSDA
jgi:hypothetical protein